MNTGMNTAKLLVAMALGLLAVSQAQAALPTFLSFQGITNNNAGASADGAANLKAEIIDLGAHVGFRFTNNSNYSSIADVYFDDGALLAISQITSSPGVSFSQGASPPNLPGGNSISPAFQTTAGFLADSDSPVSPNGVQNSDATGEWLQISFSLKPGKSFADVIAALALPTGGDWLRIGLHVQSFQGGYSESFINQSVSAIPEPGAYALMLGGLGLLVIIIGRRRTR